MLYRVLENLVLNVRDAFSPAIRERNRSAHALYLAGVAQARRPHFYEALQVPDTLDGRFDLIVLHVHLVVRRLGNTPLSEAVMNTMFADMDRSLREMSVGDVSMGKRVRKMGEAYYSRGRAYLAGLDTGDEALAKALKERIYRNSDAEGDVVGGLAAYVRTADQFLAAQANEALEHGTVSFPDPEQGR